MQCNRSEIKTMIKYILAFSLLLNLVLLGYLYNSSNQLNVVTQIEKKDAQEGDAEGMNEINIVMLGNSITRAGNWNQDLGRDDVFNGGKPGWTTEQISWVIKDFVTPNNPVLCFFKAGINDYTLGISTERIIQNIQFNMDEIKKAGTQPVFQTTLYQRGNTKVNREIDKLNEAMIAFSIERGYEYVDLRPFLCENGDIKDEYVKGDNTHLTPEAYPVWAEAIKPMIEKYGL